MNKIIYNFRAVQPIHTGAESSIGTLKMLRREKQIGVKQQILTKFGANPKYSRTGVAYLLYLLWDKMEQKNRVTIYWEITNHLSSCASAKTIYELVQRLSMKLKIKECTTNNEHSFDIVDTIELFSYEELIQLIRFESMYIVALFRKIKDQAKNDITIIPSIVEKLREIQLNPFEVAQTESEIDYIPTIPGNSIRGRLRRLAIYDFCELSGIKQLDKKIYHRLMTGGILNKGEGGYEDIAMRELLINMCPMIGLFGTAWGSQTIQGELRVGQPKLHCVENGNGKFSHNKLTSTIFATKLDSSKQESEIEIISQDGDTHQMLYEYEVYSIGAMFEHSFTCTSINPIVISAFNRLLHLFVIDPVIGAKSNIEHGEIDLSELEVNIDFDSEREYVNYISEKKELIKDFWEKQS